MTGSRRTVCERQDGGYAWFIVLGSFISHFCVLGTARSLGIIYIELLEKFNETAVRTAAVSALFNTMRMVLAPLVSMFCKRFSCRLSMLLGGVIFCCGFVSSAFVQDLWYLNFTYGLVGGVGACMLFTPPYIILNQYFDKKKGIANSLGTLGAGAGSVAIAPLIVFFMSTYAYFGGMLLLGALQLHNCISGALFRPFKSSRSNQTLDGKEEANGGKQGKNPVLLQFRKIEEFSSKLSLSHADGLDSIIHTDEIPQKYDKGEIKNISKKVDRLQSQNSEMSQEYDNKGSDYLVEGSVNQVEDDIDTSHKDRAILDEMVSKDLSPEEFTPETDNSDNNKHENSSLLQKMKANLRKKAQLFKNTTIVLYLLTVAVMPMSHGMVMWFIADSARLNGIGDTNAALLLSFFGIADMIGRVAWGPFFDIPCIRPRRRLVHALLGVIIGTTVISFGFISTYVEYACLACTFGLFEGGYHAQRMAVISEIVDKSMLEESVGITIFFQGLGNMVGPLVAGYSRDRYGNYRLGYFVGGSSQVILCALFMLDYALKNRKKK